MYESYLCEVPEINQILEEVNENKWEIVTIVHLSESQQLLVVVKQEKSKLLTLFEKKEEE